MYKFANKYGANVDGYSPIYTPDTWSESGEHLRRGTLCVSGQECKFRTCRYSLAENQRMRASACMPVTQHLLPVKAWGSLCFSTLTLSLAGDSYKLGTKGLIAWAGLIVVLLGVGINLVISTSALGQ